MEKEHIAESIKEYNWYQNPMTVLDTDYDNYLVLYKCREEFRLPNMD